MTEELRDLFPPGGHLAALDMLAPSYLFRECASLEACRLPLEFNLQVIQEEKNYTLADVMFMALIENNQLGDADLAALIQRFAGLVWMKDKAINNFARVKPNYPLSRQALLASVSDNSSKEYPEHILEGLDRLSYEQSEGLKQIVANGDSPQAIGNVLGYSQFAFGERVRIILHDMLRLGRIESFKLLFSRVDLVHFAGMETKGGMFSLLQAAHEFQRAELFEYLVTSDQFVPDQIVGAVGRPCLLYRACHLHVLLDIIERIAAINDKILEGGILLASTTFNILGGHLIWDSEMAVLLGRLLGLGVSFDQEAVVALEGAHPDYGLARQFLINHLPDVKEPAGNN
jgi:hypothetical protein